MLRCTVYIVKDLVPDLTQFYKQYKSIEPYLQNDNPPADREFLQSQEDRKKLDGCVSTLPTTHLSAISHIYFLPLRHRNLPCLCPFLTTHVCYLYADLVHSACTSASCARAARPRAPATGGTRTSTLGLRRSWLPTAGWQTLGYVRASPLPWLANSVISAPCGANAGGVG